MHAAKESINAHLASDVEILNQSLSGEYFGIAAYDAAIGSGLLEEGIIAVARQFQGDHRQHADAVLAEIEKAGATPTRRKNWEEMAAEFPPPPLESQEDVLRYAAELECSAVRADVQAVARIHSPELRRLVASIAGVEAMHWAVLRSALGENPVPAAFISSDD